MKAAYVATPSPDDPVGAIEVGDCPMPETPDGWAEVEVYAGALNMHDLWMLRGAVPLTRERTVLGSDAAGMSSGQEVVVYPVLPLPDPGRNVAHGTLVSDLGHGLFAETAVVPRQHLAPKPAHLSWAEAAALPTAWLTAWRMLFTRAGLRAGDRVLVQGAGGGVATAAIALAAAAGASVVVTSRSPEKAERARTLGAEVVAGVGARLADPVDIVIDPVGPATFKHSLASTKVGGRIVTCGSSTGFVAEIDLAKLFAREIAVMGSTTGTPEEFGEMLDFVARHELRPPIDSVADLDAIAVQAQRMLDGTAFGKLCVSVR